MIGVNPSHGLEAVDATRRRSWSLPRAFQRAVYAPLIAIVLLSFSGDAWAFLPSGLRWAEQDIPVTYAINEHGSDDFTFEQLEALFEASFATWTEVPCTTIEVQYLGTTTTETLADEEHVMSFVEEDWNGDPFMLAATMTTVAGVNPPRITVDIAFNGDTITWVVGGGGADLSIVDPQAVMTHEIGHMLGLSHTLDDGAATMSPAYLPDFCQRTLSHDDKAGICSLYPSAEVTGECDPAADACPEGSACGQIGEWSLCIEERDGMGEPCNVHAINCQDLCVYTRLDLEEGFCSRLCVEDEDCAPEGLCRPFGQSSVCRRRGTAIEDPPDGEDAADATTADTSDPVGSDTRPEFHIVDDPIAEEAVDVAPEDTLASDPELPPDGDEGSCGCRTLTAPHPPATPWLLLALLAVLGVRTRTHG